MATTTTTTSRKQKPLQQNVPFEMLEPENLRFMTVKNLRDHCRNVQLRVSGNKDDLVARLAAYLITQARKKKPLSMYPYVEYAHNTVYNPEHKWPISSSQQQMSGSSHPTNTHTHSHQPPSVAQHNPVVAQQMLVQLQHQYLLQHAYAFQPPSANSTNNNNNNNAVTTSLTIPTTIAAASVSRSAQQQPQASSASSSSQLAQQQHSAASQAFVPVNTSFLPPQVQVQPIYQQPIVQFPVYKTS